MKKATCWLLVLSVLLSLGAAALADDAMQTEEEYSVIAEQEMDFYLIDEDDVRTCSVFFIDGSDVPYVSLDDWAGLMVDAVKKTLTEEEPDYTLTFSMEDGIGYLTREDGYSVFFDSENDVISFYDFDAFLRLNKDRLLIDMLSVDDLGSDGSPKPFQRDWDRSYERYGDSLTLELGEYGIDLVSDDGNCYVPLQTLSDFMLSPYYINVFYNGEAAFLMSREKMGSGDELSPMEELFYAVEPHERSKSMAEFAYAELCLALDRLYGLKEVHRIESFDALAGEVGLKNPLKSTDPAVADEALYRILTFHLDDLHSSFNHSSPLNKETAQDLQARLVVGQSYIEMVREMYRYTGARDEARPDGIPAYEEIGNTAYITFDGFTSIPEDVNYYETAPTAETEDTIGIMLYAYAQITREDSPVENVVLDLSCNTGGDVDSAIFTVATFLGTGSLSVANTMSGALSTAVYRIDANLDGEFDENDRSLRDKELFCLISPLSFSCGNMVPNIFKNSNRVTLLGRTSGGGSCAVLPLSTADGTNFQISSYYRLSFLKNGSFYDIDLGAAPDIPLIKPASFYDREALTEYLNELR